MTNLHRLSDAASFRRAHRYKNDPPEIHE